MAKRNFFESNNPMMKEKILRQSTGNILDAEFVGTQKTMTVQGGVNKTFTLFGVMLISTALSYLFPSKILMWTGMIGIPVISFLASRNVEKARTFAPLFTLALGLMVGTATYVYGAMYDGIIFQAVSLTFAIMFTMLALYKSGVIKVTERLRNIIAMATGAIMLTYLVSIVLSLFSIDMPFLHDQSPIGIGISMVIVGVASFKLLVDFDNFHKGEEANAPEHMEWFFAMGLLFTLVWLYLEILYLLSALASSD